MIDLMTKPKTIGELLKSIHIGMIGRENRQVNQNELAAWFGIDSILFNKYYNDTRTPAGGNLEKIAAKVGPVAYFLAGQVPPGIKERVSKIPPDRLDELEQLIDDFMRGLGLEEE